MQKKTKQIILISGISIGAITLVTVPIAVVITIKNNQPKIIKVDNNFSYYIYTFIQNNKITNHEWFNNSENYNYFKDYLNNVFSKVDFNVIVNEKQIIFEIQNNFNFDTDVNVSNIEYSNNSKTIYLNVVWYNPKIFNTFSNNHQENLVNITQKYINSKKITKLDDLVNDIEFKQIVTQKLNDWNLENLPNSELLPNNYNLSSEDIEISANTNNSIKISIKSYINAMFSNDVPKDIIVTNSETYKEISIMNIALYNVDIDLSNDFINSLQQILFRNNIIFPTYINQEINNINISNNDFINDILLLLNSIISKDDVKLNDGDIVLSMSLISKNESYSNFLPNVAKIYLQIDINENINFEFNNLTSLSDILIINNGKTVKIPLYAYNGLVVNDAMINSSTNINKFISDFDIKLSTANEQINSENGFWNNFWYTFLTGNDSADIDSEYYLDVIDPKLYTMTFGSNYIKITLNSNCGYRFYSNNLINGDIELSSNNRTILINNIVWPPEKILINTNGLTSNLLTDIFTEYKIYDPKQIDDNKNEIILSFFKSQLPPQNCILQYDSLTNSINFKINNDINSQIIYSFFNEGIESDSFKISNVVFPQNIIKPIENYLEVVQNSIFNNSIVNRDQFEEYINSIISSIFSNQLSENQYTYILTEENVSLTINSNVNIEIQIDNENISKTFVFPYTLCKPILIDMNYQQIISKEFLSENNINPNNINSIESIKKILNAIVLNENKDEIISSIANKIVIVYSPTSTSTFSISDNLVDKNEPYAFSLDNKFSKTIDIELDFSSVDESNLQKNKIISRFFRYY